MNNKISNIFTIPEIKSKISKSLNGTREHKAEHAFDICSEGMSTDVERGSEYHIDINNKCPIGTRSLGNFHTHVHLSESKNDTIPSPGDMMETIERNLDFVCVSGNHKRGSKTRCFLQKDIKSEIGNVLEKRKLEHNEENVRKSARSITKKMMRDKDYLERMSHKINV